MVLAAGGVKAVFPHNAALNDIIYWLSQSVGMPSPLEPAAAGLYKADGRYPDKMSIIPWKCGKCLLWDATGGEKPIVHMVYNLGPMRTQLNIKLM